MLCYIMIYYIVLCYIVLYYIISYYIGTLQAARRRALAGNKSERRPGTPARENDEEKQPESLPLPARGSGSVAA